jgi:hemerythrin
MIQWDDSFSVHVAEIDRQHQKLIWMVNDLGDAMHQGKSRDILGKIIQKLSDYAGTHFKTEEKYFDKFGYSETDAHKREHADFTRKVADFKKAFDAGKLTLSIDVMNFLWSWLQTHIKGADRKYGPFFNEKGLK